MNPRPYQTEAIDATLKEFEQSDTTLIVMPTGCGKTIVFANILERLIKSMHVRGIVMAHREELITQAVDKIHAATNLKADIEMADQRSYRGGFFGISNVVVTTIQTQVAGRLEKKRMHQFNPHEFGIAVIDECHHAPAVSYRTVIGHYRQNPKLKLLGVTATPDRKDEKALGQVFGSVAYVYEIQDAIRDGWLVPRTTAGDLNGGDLAYVMEQEKNLHEVAGPTMELADGRKTLLFAASVAHAERLCEIFNRHVPDSARWVCGRTPKDERRTMFRDYKRGVFQILCNVGIATEGFDEPSIEVIAMARPTKSRALYAQMVGRSTRPLTGLVDGVESADGRRRAIVLSDKPHAEIIDFAGNAGRHKLISVADILGGNYDDDVIARAAANIKEASDDKSADVVDELAKAERQIASELEAERRRKIRARTRFSTKQVNPFEVLDVMPQRERGWYLGRLPSEKQAAFLERNGIDAQSLTFTHASQLIGQIIERREQKLCTFKQARRLKIHGYTDADSFSFTKASEILSELAANGWKRRHHAVA
jgi:superfamily II DNA or RNA helicase